MERFNIYLEENKFKTSKKIRSAEEETKKKQAKIKELKKKGELTRGNQGHQNHDQHEIT